MPFDKRRTPKIRFQVGIIAPATPNQRELLLHLQYDPKHPCFLSIITSKNSPHLVNEITTRIVTMHHRSLNTTNHHRIRSRFQPTPTSVQLCKLRQRTGHVAGQCPEVPASIRKRFWNHGRTDNILTVIFLCAATTTIIRFRTLTRSDHIKTVRDPPHLTVITINKIRIRLHTTTAAKPRRRKRLHQYNIAPVWYRRPKFSIIQTVQEKGLGTWTVRPR